MRRRNAFTLVELLIVLAVIAALLATLTPVAVNAVRQAQASAITQDMRAIREAAQSYFYIEQTDAVTGTNSILAANEGIVRGTAGEDNVATLRRRGYLTNDPSGFSVGLIPPATLDGSYTVAVIYHGGAVDFNFLKNAWRDVEKYEGTDFTANNAIVTSTVIQFWR